MDLANVTKDSFKAEVLEADKLIIVDFWATWCKPCLQSIPKLNELSKEFKNKNVGFIGISIDSPRNISKVKPLVKAMKVEYPILLDPNNEVMADFNITAIPTLLIINHKNDIVYFHEGYKQGDEVVIKNEIQKLLATINKK